MSTMTPTAFAELVESDGRTVRKFLRAITPKDEQPGKGSRWELPGTKRELNKLTKQFTKWSEELAAAKAEPVDADLTLDDEPTNEMLEEPTDAELEEIDEV